MYLSKAWAKCCWPGKLLPSPTQTVKDSEPSI